MNAFVGMLIVGGVIGGPTGVKVAFILFSVLALLSAVLSDGRSASNADSEWRATFRCGRCGTEFRPGAADWLANHGGAW